MAIKFNTDSNADESSFALLRTNPKLTSNIKLVVDSEDSIFLSAFKANKVLAKVEYQKFEISDRGTYSNDIARFFKGTPISERFQTLKKYSDITAYSDYSYQYEDQYNYGASFNSTKLYDEQYRIFAPIWLDRKIPKKFVIYRVSDVDYKNKYNEDTLGQNSRILELLSGATIIKTFDLTRDSNVGKYLNSHVFSEGMPNSAIEFNFSDNGAVLYRGIDSTNGGFVSKKDFISGDYIEQDDLEIGANELITKGFERHGVISANLINLEFMFDDHSAENYEIYRYFGLYVDDIEEGTFAINAVSNGSIIEVRPDSVNTTYNVGGAGLSHEKMLPETSELKVPSLSYVNLGSDRFLHVKNGQKSEDLKIKVNSDIDISALLNSTNFSVSSNKLQALSKKISNKPFIKFEITEKPEPNDRFYIGDKTEIELSNNNLYNFTLIAAPENIDLAAGSYSGNYFSTKGTLSQVALAISRLIKNITSYNTKADGASIVVEDYGNGDNRQRMQFGIYDGNTNTGFINIENAKKITDTFDWESWTAGGGSKVGASFLVNSDELGEVEVGQYVKHVNLNKYSKIIDIAEDHENLETYRVIIEREFKIPTDGTVQLYDIFAPSFGKFSAYSLKDFDFDFYSTKNSELGELEYEEYGADNFTGLSPVLYQDDVDDKILTVDVKSEYDRLNENKLKETALTSRVVPTIMKYALKDGNNARNLPYMLNVNEAFGPNNLSPEIRLESGRNYDNLNMEHFHFNKIPDNFYTNNTLNNLSSYTSFTTTDGISLDQLKSTDVDYFSLYFNWKGAYNNTEGTWVDDKFKKLYSSFNGGTAELEPNTVFRGLRYIYKKRKEFLKESPTAFEQTTETNSYKFGVTLDYVQGREKNEVKYTVIKNDTFKFICVVIQISVVENDVKSLSRSSVYELNDIKLEGTIVSTDLSFDIDLGSTDWSDTDPIDTEYIVKTSDILNDLAPPAFTKEITKNEDGEYSWIYFEVPGLTGDIFGGMKVSSIIDDTQIKIKGIPRLFTIGDGPFYDQAPLTESQLETVSNMGTGFKYWETGSAGWKNLLEEVVSYNFAKRFNNFGEISYISVGDYGEVLNGFVLEIQDGVDFVKPSMLDTAPDGEKPRSYQLGSKEIGKILKGRDDGGYFTVLRRMNGEYNPLFIDVVDFTEMYTEVSTAIPGNDPLGIYSGEVYLEETSDLRRKALIYNKFKNKGIAFASYKDVNDSYGFINNYHYHKVNDENSKNLLKLSETTDKLPLYPVIGEIAIDKKDFNIFKSKYASDYFTKALPGSDNVTVYGTLSPVELKSFMSSTIMKVKDQYDLTSFSQTIETSIDSLDSIRFNKLNKTAIHWLENDSEIIADFYLPKTIYNELLEDGIQSKFSKYLTAENSFGDKTTVLDDLERYVYSNIVSRFIIENTEIYGIAGKNITTDFKSVDSPAELKDGRFVKQTNFDIQGYQNDGLSFRLIYNKKPGFKYHLKLHIKIQA